MDAMSGVAVTISNPMPPTAEEMAIIEPRDSPSIVTWAPENLRLPAKETKLDGPFDFEYSPHLRGLCQWFTDPYVREITVMACLQAGKTLFTMVCLAWLMQFAPGPTMVVMTDENTLRRRMKRLRPMFEVNACLLRKLGGRAENLFIGEPTDLGDMLLVLAWSNSAAAIADYPIRYVFADEVALWQPTVGTTDIDALSQLRGRQNTYEGESKLVKVSSPRNLGDLMDTEFEEGDRCEYWVPCPKCDVWQVLRWYDSAEPGCRAVLDRDKSGDWLRPRDYESGRHVRYVCPSCMKPWTDYHRAAALQRGVWLPDGVTMDRTGRPSAEPKPAAYRSARIRGLMVHPRLRSIRKMAAEWVRGQLADKSGNRGPLKHFLNNHEGESWKETRATTDESRVRRHIGQYRSGLAPVGVQVITVAIDVQVDHLRYAVVGWGYLYECWPIEFGRLETGDTKEIENYEMARQLVCKPWPLAGRPGLVLPPALSVIDSQYNTETVLNFCRANAAARVVPAFGSARQMMRPYSRTAIDHIIHRYEVNPLWYKDQAHRMLFVVDAAGGGYMHLPADVTPEVVGELCAEHKMMRKGRPIWLVKDEHRANHSWDLAYLSCFAATIVGVGTLGPYQRPEPPAPPRPKPARSDFFEGLPDLGSP